MDNIVNKIICGDWIKELKKLPAGIFHCCVTSPPYWGQRDYGWGGDGSCWNEKKKAEIHSKYVSVNDYLEECPKCGRQRPLLGLEKTPEEHIEKLVEGFREVRRVLRDDGVMFLNYGDKYSTGGAHNEFKKYPNVKKYNCFKVNMPDGNILMLPARVAIALQADGWILRDDIIWAKAISFNDKYSGSTMPESVNGWRWERHRVKIKKRPSRNKPNGAGDNMIRVPGCENGSTRLDMSLKAEWADCPGCEKCEANGGLVLRKGSWRCTKAHEHVFQFVKTNNYFCDMEAVREESADTSGISRIDEDGRKHYRKAWKDNKKRDPKTDLASWAYKYGSSTSPGGRNLRNVWTINPRGYKDAHYACVDAKTECLTTKGWMNLHKLPQGAEIVAYNGERLQWEPAVFSIFPFNGELVKVECRYLSMRLTPNHRVLKKLYRGKEWSICRADELLNSHAIPISSEFYPRSEYKLPHPAMAALAGWVLTDGGYNQGNSITIYQTKDYGRGRIRDILSKLEINAKVYMRKRNPKETSWTFNGYYAEWLRQTFPRKEGNYEILNKWSDADLLQLWQGMVGGDGNRRKDGRITFVGSKVKVDFFQALSIRMGKACRVSNRNRYGDNWAAYISFRKTATLRGANAQGGVLSKEKYKGLVWCPSVPSGLWLARRNGRTFITGNTFPEALVEPMIKVATSQKGVCPKCGSPWARIIKKPSTTLSFKATCGCGIEETVPALVLDPFIGSATTAVVAVGLGRNYFGCEVNPDYAANHAGLRCRSAETGLKVEEINAGQGALFE